MDSAINYSDIPNGFQVMPQSTGFSDIPQGFNVVNQPQIGTGEDMLKSVAGGLEKGGAATLMLAPNLGNQLAAGPQYLGRGIAEGVDSLLGVQPQPRGDIWQPFYSSEDVLKQLPEPMQPHQPQTGAGTITDFLSQLAGGIGATKGIQEAPNMNIIQDESSGLFPRPSPPGPDASPAEKLGTALESAQQQTRFSRPTNPLEAGQQANEAISHQYGIDTALQRQHYQDLNQIGRSFTMPADEVYNKGNSLVGSLESQVAPESYERTALGNLKDIMDNLQSKNAVPSEGNKYFVPDEGNPLKATGMQPSDAVDIKTTLNQLARSGKFTNAGQSKILDFKNYIQDFLDKASETSPEFGDALDKAESQAARVGLYRDPKLSGLWQPKPDYMSYKGETETPPATFDRMANFMSKLNSGSPAAGESYALSQILPHEQVTDIFRNALLQNKQAPEGILQKFTNPFGVRTFMGQSPDSPLLNLADQLRGMQ